ncbi:estradiol 17-beta-dehydrogenase 11-like isoform X2 [Aricia agestis]|uniref:estradiol 17-beta-dehydrogenase 11-like isoform X2 n=1 Tax=Aricia agestis TaxID=91739 RepID=UPI001C2039F3|nr:estradiol 17-beta-dehydrogenase 11-like isoform X2 [Aricia agestis]
MSTEYLNGGRPGPLTREIPECMRDKFSTVQRLFELLSLCIFAAGCVIQAIYRSIVGYKKKDLSDKIALVTGGGGGLGSLIALRLARLGCVVVLWDINKQGLEDTVKLVKGVGGRCYGFYVDLASREDIYRVTKKVQEEVGRVSLLVNNAGVLSGHYFLETPDNLIQRTFDVNILAHCWTVKAMLPAMIEHNDGHIVTIASMAGHVGVSKLVDYCSSKSAACGFHDALSTELNQIGATGVHTSLVCPYFIRATGMFETVNSRLVPTLSSNEVADRVVHAIRTNEPVAIIPAYFRWFMPFKWLLPSAVTTEAIKRLVPDAVPTPLPAKNGKPAELDTKEQHQPKKDSRPMLLHTEGYDRQVNRL